MAKKVLLADDSVTIQKVVELVLSEEDFEIRAVNNGKDALQQVAAFRPDIVLADIEMPELNGYQLCDELKKDSNTSHIPVVLLAGAFEPLDEDLARNVGADGFIVKPFESQELISKVNASLTAAAIGQEGIEVEIDQGAAETAEVMAFEEGEPVSTAVPNDEDLWALEDVEVGAVKDTEEWEFEEEPEVAGEGFKESGLEDLGELPAEEIREGASREADDEVTRSAEVQKPTEVRMPDEKAVLAVLREEIARNLERMLATTDLVGMVERSVTGTLTGTLDGAVRDLLPEIIQRTVNEAISESMGRIRSQVENVIWETVPDLAETIIRKEIDNIRAQI